MASKSGAVDRRGFIRLGALTPGLIVGAGVSPNSATPAVQMQYRPLGATGLKVSEIAFGTYGFNNPELLSAAVDAGINLVVTCGEYQDGAAERAIGKFIGKAPAQREKLVILTGATVRKGRSKDTIMRSLEGSLQRLGTDRVEIFKTHSVESPGQLQVEELFEFYEEAREAGKIRFLGFSGHGRNLANCLQTALAEGRFHVVLCRYDFVSYRVEQEQAFGEAAKKGMGVIAFKISAGERQKEIRDLETSGISFRQATVKWALSNPGVCAVAAGITNFDQIREYCGAVGKPLEAADRELLDRYASEMYSQYCRNCGSCEASCPRQVPVADIMRYAMYFKYYGREKDSMRLYASLASDHNAGACFNCSGPCRGACPYNREIRQGLMDAHLMLT